MALSPEAIQYQTAHINDERVFVPQVSVVISLATVAVTLRLVARQWTKVGFRADDYLIVVATAIAWGMFIGNVYEKKYGQGKHFIASSIDDINRWAKLIFWEDLAYCTATLIVQSSFLLFYRRVFTLESPRFRFAVFAVFTFAFASWISIFFASIFLCHPIAYKWDKSIDGSCGNPQTVFLSGLSINLLTDIFIVLLPIPMIWHLNISRTEKFAVLGAFILGGFCCVGNLIRLPYLINVDQEDLTCPGSLVNGEVWGTAEVCIAIIAACLPCYRPFLRSIGHLISSRYSSEPSKSRSEGAGNGAVPAMPQYRWDTLPRNGVSIGVETKALADGAGGEESRLDLEKADEPSISVKHDLIMTSNRE